MGGERSIAVRERMAEGPRDNYGRAAGGILWPDDEPEMGREAVPGLAGDAVAMWGTRWFASGEPDVEKSLLV